MTTQFGGVALATPLAQTPLIVPAEAWRAKEAAARRALAEADAALPAAWSGELDSEDRSESAELMARSPRGFPPSPPGSDEEADAEADAEAETEAAAAEQERAASAPPAASKPRRRRRRRPRLCVSEAGSTTDLCQLVATARGWRLVRSVPESDKAAIFMFSHLAGGKAAEFRAKLQLLKPRQRVSKVPGVAETSSKISLSRHLRRASAVLCGGGGGGSSAIDTVWPETWVLPGDERKIKAVLLQNNAKKRRQMTTLILKPDEGSQGEGISLLQRPADLTAALSCNRHSAIVQRYLPAPLLLEGLKFDLRLYVLISSVSPLRAHLCTEGLARVCTKPYEAPSSRNLYDTMSHLTNYSLNKRSDGYIEVEGDPSGGDGSKRALSATFRTLGEAGAIDNVDELWQRLDRLCALTVAAMSPTWASQCEQFGGEAQGERIKSGGSFQIIGLDVLLDETGAPWLLESNANPSLCIDLERTNPETKQTEHVPSAIDEFVKLTVLAEALEIVKRQRMPGGLEDSQVGGDDRTANYRTILPSEDAVTAESLQRLHIIQLAEDCMSGLRDRHGRLTSSRVQRYARAMGVSSGEGESAQVGTVNVDLVFQAWSQRPVEEHDAVELMLELARLKNRGAHTENKRESEGEEDLHALISSML